MAKVYQLVLDSANSGTQADLDKYGHSLLFAESMQPVYAESEGGVDTAVHSVVVTSTVESEEHDATMYQLLADDSQSELSIDVSTGKFVEGNLIAVWCPTSEARSDLRDFMTFYATSGTVHLHVGVCNTTQSQDYTPEIINNDRALLMLSPAQVATLNI